MSGEHERFAKWADEAGKKPNPIVPAATVVVLRDSAAGLETLMMRRSSKLSFVGGMWVFPGGRVDEADYPSGRLDDVFAASRVAATREAVEEAGLTLDAETLVSYSHWVPPAMTPKRFATWFFVARAPVADVHVDGGEIKEHAWWHPADTLQRHRREEIEMAPPTHVTLLELAEHDTVDSVLEAAAARETPRYATRIALRDGAPVALWAGDAGYDTTDPDVDGPRHRLTMSSGDWRFEKT